MWYHFFIFELNYRLRRPETYGFFLFLLLFSVFGVEFVFQGIELGLVKKNAPLVIAKTMGAITGLSMLVASIVMGVPVLRDFQYDIASLHFVNPISKKDYLTGRFLGSFVVLLLIFSAVFWGMQLGEFMPWVDRTEYLPFQLRNYLQPFLVVALPILFFGACVFFVSGSLSKHLMVVYTQGIFIFVLFMLTKGITNKTGQALLDPFSLTTLSKATEGWTPAERNAHLIPVSGIMLANKLFWMVVGLGVLAYGYLKFRLKVDSDKASNKKRATRAYSKPAKDTLTLPLVNPVYDVKAQLYQLIHTTWFHAGSILKLTSFWAIILCCFIIIIINSLSLGTAYSVDSYPTTYLIIEELQEMSLYFFMIILVFYSGEIMWKEKEARLHLMHDASPVNSMVNLSSRFFALLIIYALVMLSLILGGILFQTAKGYYTYDLPVYFSGFFLELFPFLALYTFAALFFQALTGRKFIGMLATIIFAIVNVGLGVAGFEHPLVSFAGQTLAGYSEMNGYGHFLLPFLWIKTYWGLFGILLLILASVVMVKGTKTGLKNRWKSGIRQMSIPLKAFTISCIGMFILVGGFIFYNTNIVNHYWTEAEKSTYRAGYEKSLKQFESIAQPKIDSVQLKVDLFPSKRGYEIEGQYSVRNKSNAPIREIHLQKQIEADVQLSDISFSQPVSENKQFERYEYTIYTLEDALLPGESLNIRFRQSCFPTGFEASVSPNGVLFNGTFIDNKLLPSFGYQKKYELQDEAVRKDFGLLPRVKKAPRDDRRALANARSGSDSEGILLDVVISTEAQQTALSSGELISQWEENNRNYFHYKTKQKIIDFYPIVSASYRQFTDSHIPAGNTTAEPVDLAIYYHQGHEYNLSRMMESMKQSLDYYSTNFSAYPYQELSIVEFPRYRSFAQSFPGIIPFSEAMGFIMDIRDEQDVDMAFYVTAHEVAHQWWGLQLEAANVQGQLMILETLAQYSAMMVLKEKYPEEKVRQFLKLQKEDYLEARLKSDEAELPLALVEDQSHIYYNKGAINMYRLKEQIGEENVNAALRNFLSDWHSFDNPKKPDRYPTTIDMLRYIRKATPKEKQAVITALFEEVNELIL